MQNKLMSFLRYIEYDEAEEGLVSVVGRCEKAIQNRIKQQQG